MAKMKTSYTFAVTLPDVSGVTIPQLREYLRDAVGSYKGGLDKDDPLFSIDFSNMKIHLTNKEVKYGA